MEIDKDIAEILESPFWPKILDTKEMYSRVHDDSEGDKSQTLNVCFSQDGDAWLSSGLLTTSLRFRTDFGGGNSLRTRNALLILAMAIKLDNEEFPQKKK